MLKPVSRGSGVGNTLAQSRQSNPLNSMNAQISQTIPNAAGDRSVLAGAADYLSGVNSVMSRGSGLHDVKEIHRTMDSGTKQRRASPEALALMMANMKSNNESSKARMGMSGANWVPGGG